ncbi:leucine-rich repeat protein [Butyribacter sp.]|uniref:leucine-rich repeat protein n=1 Tax=Butyribacter sp. TaxID=2822465 RepID=UPI002A98AF40|nr:leucine-rich repeat protein [Butyribacter sp.]
MYIPEKVVGKNVKKFDANAISRNRLIGGGCTQLEKITVSKENKYLKIVNGVLFNKKKTKLLIYPPKKKGSTYELPNSTKHIGWYAFDSCVNLKNMDIGMGLKKMYAANTTDFKYATPENVTEADMCAFRGRDNIKEIDIGGEIEELSWYSLINCSNLETLKLSSKLKSFDRDMTAYSFDNDLTNLKNIIVDEGNTEYESYNNELFEKGKKNLILLPYGSDSIVIPKETEYICGGIAKNKFKNIKVEDGNKYFSVNSNVLYNKDITEIIIFPSYKTTYTLPATLKEFPSMTYMYTEDYLDIEGEAWITRADENLECVKVAKGNEVYKAVDGVLYLKNTKQLEYYPPAKKGSYKIIEGTKYVNNAAFIYTKYLTSLTVPDSVKSIIISPKDSESLKEITVPVKCEVIKMTKREGSGVKVYRSLVLKC